MSEFPAAPAATPDVGDDPERTPEGDVLVRLGAPLVGYGVSRTDGVKASSAPSPAPILLTEQEIVFGTSAAVSLQNTTTTRRLADALNTSSVLKSAKPYSLAIAFFVAGAIVVGVGAVLGFKFGDERVPHFGLELAKATVTLGSGLILGGAVKVMLDRYQEAQKERDKEHEVRERLLANLRDVHDRAESARLMVTAHRSAKAYCEQMRELIGCQVVLLKVGRSLDLRLGSTRDVDPKAVCLEDMIGYLRALQNEYASNYSLLADCQGYDDAITSRRLNALAAANTPFDPNAIAASHRAWDLMSDPKKFPVLNDLTKCGERYATNFRQPLDTLAAQLLMKEPPQIDPESDGRVDAIAHDIQAVCAALQPVERELDEEAPTADTAS